jgi:hypothetical protein
MQFPNKLAGQQFGDPAFNSITQELVFAGPTLFTLRTKGTSGHHTIMCWVGGLDFFTELLSEFVSETVAELNSILNYEVD